MKVVALISSFEEKDLLESCIKSARDLDTIFVFDGPIGSDEDRCDFGNYLGEPIKHFRYNGSWISDASKRTYMLDIVKGIEADSPNVWVLWLDGDEILIWGEYLKDLCGRAEQMEESAAGVTLKITEYDGSVQNCYGKLIRLGAVNKYLTAAYEAELSNGMTVALPNVPICSAGGIPIGEITERDDPLLAKNRPPVAGEPHLLHRYGLRDPNRNAERLNEVESDSFQTLVIDAGLAGVDNQTAERIKNNG